MPNNLYHIEDIYEEIVKKHDDIQFSLILDIQDKLNMVFTDTSIEAIEEALRGVI